VRLTGHIGFFVFRHLWLEIGRRAGARGTVLTTFVSDVHNPKIMLGMLVKALCRDSIATRRRLPREGNVTFKDLMRGSPDLDIRTVTIVSLTSARYLSITVRIVTVIATMRSAGLFWSHDTCCIDWEVGPLFNESVSEHLRRNRVGRCRAAFLYSAKLFA
jgi:hypothetical protein